MKKDELGNWPQGWCSLVEFSLFLAAIGHTEKKKGSRLEHKSLSIREASQKQDPPHFTIYNGDEDHPAHNLLLDPANYSSTESNLIFVGLAGLRDPPRKEVGQAIEDCRVAGIQVIVIT
ncbi:unnamed protein product [Lactuca virosa]|uniref:Uncharacterized protein n=1 Tax=Lactuca virosa TaxID=75947 RepID=A0AAU9NA79_9ASTR|nr:unnamed protein product [Lactuca virosa]CAH1434986.1 unnamed protein product [Lactuca virosa]